MKKQVTHVLKHWKTSLFAVFIFIFTIMLYMNKITVTEFAEAVGVAVTIVGLLAKDWDKADQK